MPDTRSGTRHVPTTVINSIRPGAEPWVPRAAPRQAADSGASQRCDGSSPALPTLSMR